MSRAMVWRRILCGSNAYAFGMAGAVGYTFRSTNFTLLGLVDAAVSLATFGWLATWVFILIVAGPLRRRPLPRTEPVPAAVDDWLTVAHAAGVARW